MATLKQYEDPYGYQDPYQDGNYQQGGQAYDQGGDQSQPNNYDTSGITAAPDYSGQPTPTPTPQATPQTPQAQAGNIDRNAFQSDWMNSQGTFDDFMKSHPQYAGQVTAHNGSKDRYDLKGTNETLDLIGDVGGANQHNWTSTGVGQNGVVDQPSGNGSGSNIQSYINQLQNQGSGSGSGSNQASNNNTYQMPAPSPDGGLQAAPGVAANGAPTNTTSKTQTQKLRDTLQGLMDSGGGFNQGIVDRRTNGAMDKMQKALKSRQASDRAMLASRGTLGSGPELTAMNRAGEGEQANLDQAVSDIYGNESQAADNRMMQALQISAGMSAAEASQALEWFKAQSQDKYNTGNLALGNKNSDQSYALGQGNLALGQQNSAQDYALGQGNLALGNQNASNNYNLGAGQLHLGYDQLNSQNDHFDLQSLIDLLSGRTNTGNQSNQGYV